MSKENFNILRTRLFPKKLWQMFVHKSLLKMLKQLAIP